MSVERDAHTAEIEMVKYSLDHQLVGTEAVAALDVTVEQRLRRRIQIVYQARREGFRNQVERLVSGLDGLTRFWGEVDAGCYARAHDGESIRHSGDGSLWFSAQTAERCLP